MVKRKWTFLTNHAVVFPHVAQHPYDTIREVASATGLCQRTVASILADLRDDRYVDVLKQGRFNTYIVHTGLPMRQPALASRSVREFIIPMAGLDTSRDARAASIRE